MASELYALLVFVFVVECFQWVKREPLALLRLGPLKPRLTTPLSMAPQLARALTFGWPLPPFGGALAVDGLGVVAGPHGVRVVAASGQTPSGDEPFVRWAELLPSASGVVVTTGATVLGTFSSKSAAAQCARRLSEWARLPASGRAQAIEAWVTKSADRASLETLIASFRGWRVAMQATQSALWLAVFGGWGLVAFAPTRPPLPLVFGLMAGCWSVAAVVAALAARRLPPESRLTRLQWVTTLGSPLGLMRAADVIAAEWFGAAPPIACLTTFLGPTPARDALAAWARRLRYPLDRGGAAASPEALEDDAWWRARWLAPIDSATVRLGATPSPAPSGRHCPRCLAEYVQAVERCANCTGVALTG